MEIDNIGVTSRSVERLVEESLEAEGIQVNFTETTASMQHGDAKLFSIRAYIEHDDGRTEQVTATVSVDLKIRKE